MQTSPHEIKGFTAENWAQRWDILDDVASIASFEKFKLGLPKEFKIERQELPHYLEVVAKQRGYDSYQALAQQLNIGKIDNAIIVLSHKVIAMDHNPGPENYTTRYLGQGKFGKVKIGIDREGTSYAIKSQRHRVDVRSEREQAIMKKIGVLIGTLQRSTTTQKPWLDNKPIADKELLVMQLIEGKPLAEYIHPWGQHYRSFKPIEREIIALGIIEAIDRLNDLGIAHRDHSLANFIIDISQFPPDVTQIDIAAYLAGKDPNYDFTKLIREVDWGLASEIPPDGSACTLQGPVYYAYYRTAPEFYIDNKSCSRASEAYTIAKLIRDQLFINNDFLNATCPPALALAMNQYESFIKETLAFSSQFRTLDEHEKQKRASESELQYQKLMDEAAALKSVFLAFPVSTRLSLSALANGFIAQITANAHSLKHQSSYTPMSSSASSHQYAEASSEYEETYEETGASAFPQDKDKNELLSSTSSAPDQMLSGSSESLSSSSSLNTSLKHDTHKHRLLVEFKRGEEDYYEDSALPPEIFNADSTPKKPRPSRS